MTLDYLNDVNSGYNELKLELLDEADDWEEVTAVVMAEALGRTHPSVSMAMLRYHRQGLLSRYTIAHNEKVYSLTSRGFSRLEWLREQVDDDKDEDDFEEDPDEL